MARGQLYASDNVLQFKERWGEWNLCTCSDEDADGYDQPYGVGNFEMAGMSTIMTTVLFLSQLRGNCGLHFCSVGGDGEEKFSGGLMAAMELVGWD